MTGFQFVKHVEPSKRPKATEDLHKRYVLDQQRIDCWNTVGYFLSPEEALEHAQQFDGKFRVLEITRRLIAVKEASQ